MATIVTGGAGFIGSHLVDVLADRGDSVVVLDNLSTGRLANLEKAISRGRVTFVYADVATDAASLSALLAASGVEKIDAIYHLAWPSAADESYEAAADAANSFGTISLIEIALAHKARFVFASASEIDNDPLAGPSSEDQPAFALAGNARSLYRAKRFAENEIANAVATNGLDGYVVRFFDCYGPRMPSTSSGLIPGLLEAVINRRPVPIFGTGRQVKSMIYISDAIKLLLTLTNEKQSGGVQPIDIAGDERRTVIEIAQALSRVADIEFNPDFQGESGRMFPDRRPDLSRARALGWSETRALEDGLRSTYNWFVRDSHLFA